MSVGRKHVGGWLARNAPDPVSVILLGKLAVDLAARHLGLGADPAPTTSRHRRRGDHGDGVQFGGSPPSSTMWMV